MAILRLLPKIGYALFYLALAVATVLLFTIDPGSEVRRVWHEFWNLGHIFLFGGAGLLIGTRLSPQHVFRNILLLLCAGAVIGWLVEIIQLHIGRDYSLIDVADDVVGLYAGLLVGGWQALKQRRRWQVVQALLLSVALLTYVGMPFMRAALDTWRSVRDFPVLVDFSSDMQRDRFESGSNLRVVDGALQVTLTTAQYSGFSLNDFPRNWLGYGQVQLTLENPSAQNLPLVCRIHDGEHEHRGYALNDRFNQQVVLQPGLNRVRFYLEQVARTSSGRHMQLDDIHNLSCFTIRLPAARQVLVRRIELE